MDTLCPEAVCKGWILGPSLQVPNSPEAYSCILPCMLNHLEVTFHAYCDVMQGRQLLHFIVKGIMTSKRICVFNMDSSVLCFVLFWNTFHLKLIDSTRAEFLNTGWVHVHALCLLLPCLSLLCWLFSFPGSGGGYGGAGGTGLHWKWVAFLVLIFGLFPAFYLNLLTVLEHSDSWPLRSLKQ